MSSLASWAYLSRVVEGPSPHLQALLRAGHDADEIARGVRQRERWIGGLLGPTERRFEIERAEDDLREAAELGYHLVTPEHSNWPSEAIQRSFSAANSGELERGCEPHVLWVRGNQNLPSLFDAAVGIVGTRNASVYGYQATADLVGGLAKHRYTIVSGGALGIDTVAHDTALAAGTPSVVVTACGPGVTYPRQNERLFNRVATQGGAIISEYPPGTTPDRHRFLTRNRLIAALSRGSVVIEAAYRSGALNTMKWARTFNRVCMSVPGSIMSQGSLGTNLLIYNKEAQMVLNADQIHELLSPVGEVDAQMALEFKHEPSPLQQLSYNELRVYDSLPPIGRGASDAETVAAAAGMAVGITVHLLLELEQRKLVARDKRLWRRVPLGDETLE
ncbi:hypothetical protein CGLAU_07900 [Corynebacterium glaucum]|uniref:Smf/DprA SLOG domain-containing protein n=1 Tax=Corynebacterium glaucum TaxID=187491 RepID=A0A1Q2HXG0_9CORY|nr:DNA-processing protein DprA [Corynebacterium glaucum]AQQ15535.1 hypothetical protein CGLAU_07900 [Corynebacterium glaucum]